MDDLNLNRIRWMKVVNSGAVVNKQRKTPRSHSPHPKIRLNSQSTTFNHCTIDVMTYVHRTHPGEPTLQLMEKTARLQSSPQLSGSSSLYSSKVFYNDSITTFALSEIPLTENVYIW